MKTIRELQRGIFREIVKFRVGRFIHYGLVTSIDKEICNIRGIEQKGSSKPKYHYSILEVRKVSTKEAFELGRGSIQYYAKRMVATN